MMKHYYKKDENGVVTHIWNERCIGENVGIEIQGPLLKQYIATDYRGIPRYKEAEPGVLEERTEAEMEADYAPPPKTRKQVFSDIKEEYGEEFLLNTLMPELTLAFKTFADQESHTGWTLCSAELNNTNLSAEVKNKIREIMNVPTE